MKWFSEYLANTGLFAENEDVMLLLIILSFVGDTSCCDEKWTSAHIWSYYEWVMCCDCLYKLILMYASIYVRNKRSPNFKRRFIEKLLFKKNEIGKTNTQHMISHMKYSRFWESFDVILVNLKKNYSMKLMFSCLIQLTEKSRNL